jgi:uncharacterized protein (DUF1330 family)
MKTSIHIFVQIVLVFSGCASLAATAQPAPTSASQASAAPGYLLVLGRSLDRPKIIAYSAALPPIYAETGGRYIGLGRPGAGVACIYGLCEGRSAVIARWDDQRSITAFWWGENYRKAVKLRDAAGAFTVVGLKGFADVTPYTSSGALLIATAASATPNQQTWLDAAAKAGARLLAPFTTDAVIPLEGDALYNRVALLSFESVAKRDAFIASDITKEFQKSASMTSMTSLLSMIAVDAPPAPK